MRLLTLVLLSLTPLACAMTAKPTHHLTWTPAPDCVAPQPCDPAEHPDPECTDPDQQADRQ